VYSNAAIVDLATIAHYQEEHLELLLIACDAIRSGRWYIQFLEISLMEVFYFRFINYGEIAGE